VDGLRWTFFCRSRDEATTAAEKNCNSEQHRTPKMARLEAVLIVAEGTLSTRRLAQLATLADAAEARSLIESLNSSYDSTASAFRIEQVASGYQMLTRPEYAPWLHRLHHRQSELKLSSPAMETLTIVAYRQPITRADVEVVRGVQCAEMLKQLMERGLVRIGGEEDSLGRPYLYETTRQFLELFGLRRLDDLPAAALLGRVPHDESLADESVTDEQDEAGPLDGDTPVGQHDAEEGEMTTAA